MQEDVLGTRREMSGDRYIQCTQCGRWFPQRQVRVIPSEEATPPPETEANEIALCSACIAETEAPD